MNEQSGSGQSVGGDVAPVERVRPWIEAKLEAARNDIRGVVANWPDSHRLDEFTKAVLEARVAIDRARRILREGR